MTKFGFTLSSEEFSTPELVALAHLAEKSGFDFSMISDHFHPWVEAQGHSPFVWTTLGAISQVTSNLIIGTGVTCPIIRTHPVIIAQAAATTATLLENRFILGLGTGENLNEHVVGEGWPIISVRQAMLREAVDIIRQLWQGGNQTIYGDFFVIEDARLYTLPKILPPIFIAASGIITASIAGEMADGLIITSPDKELINAFRQAGGKGKPIIAQMSVCYAAHQDEALEIVRKVWPIIGIKGQLSQELRIPQYFQQVTSMVNNTDISSKLPLGPDPRQFVDMIQKYISCGVTHLYFHQIGPHQSSFINFFHHEVKPLIASS